MVLRRAEKYVSLGAPDAIPVAVGGAEERLGGASLRRRQHPEEGDQHAGGGVEEEGGEGAVLRALGAVLGAARGQPRLRDGHGDEGGRGGVRLRRDSAGRGQSTIVRWGRRG